MMEGHKKNTLRFGIFCVIYIAYVILGGFGFMLVESPLETSIRHDVRILRQTFKEKATCITDAELEEFIVKIVRATNRGISAVRNVTSSNPNWSFGQSLFFAGTVITTIGYGRVTPLSEAGKGFCVLYAIIGIPLTLIMFTAIVERLMIPTSWFLQFMFRKLGHLYKVFHIQLLHLTVIITLVIVFFYLIPAAIYVSIEPNWNYLDAFYYCFISLTTVGLGDYIPGDSPDQPLRPLYKVATTFYLFIGLMMMMLILAVLYEIPELNIGFHFYLKSDTDEDERMRLQSSATSGQKYSKQIDEEPAPASEYQGIPSFPRPQATYQSTDGSLQQSQ
ncbi:potassium channel subfamily K member 1-like isoform X4 [Mercenaria mercenaria]|uniref:potassium channel subfamily K member 1-like isoform X4 n=1 Tax=Mercenaria mercenaria TaxID=6596 RepID=UPI00234E5D5B|nr:potassium channel subfamily K member 1-like isoform X4 [Mercenaria mercenaria]